MRHLSLLVLCVLCTSALFAQSLNGKIINGLGEEGLPNVRVEVSGFATAFSDQELGTFSLSLPGLRPGAKIPLDIAKEGYAVINREATQPRLPDNPLERVYIRLAPTDKRDEMALSFYKINVERNIQVNFDAAAKKFAEEANYSAIAKLHEDKESALKLSDSLAARLARFDPKLASDDLTRAMQLYQAGKAQEALKILDAEKIMTRIEGRKDVITEMEAANRQDVASLMKAGDISLTEFEFEKAQQYYQTAVEADSTNWDNLIAFSNFLDIQNQSQALIPYAKRLRRLAKEEEQIVWALTVLGNALSFQGHVEAIDSMQKAAEISHRLKQINPKRFEPLLARTILDQGVVNSRFARYEEAVNLFEQSLEIYKQLAQINLEKFEPELARTLGSLGKANRRLGRMEVSIRSYEQSLTIFKKLAQAKPKQFEYELAMTYGSLGVVRINLGHYEEAIQLQEQALEIIKKLAQNNPQGFGPSLGVTFTNLGIVNGQLGHAEEALRLHEEALKIRQELAKNNPQRFEPNFAKALMNLGIANYDFGKYQEAMLLFQQAFEIHAKFAQINPQRFEPELSKNLINLGVVHDKLGRNEDAIRFYEEALDINMDLARRNPQRFELQVAKNLKNLGVAFQRQLLRSPHAAIYDKGKKTIVAMDSSFARCPDIPSVQMMKESAKVIQHFFQTVDLTELELIIPSHALRDSLIKEELLPEKIALQQQIITIYEDALKNYPEAPSMTDSLSKSLDSLANWQLFDQDLVGAEASIQQCLDINQDYSPIYRWQAPALLLQGKFSKAKKVYLAWEDQVWPKEEAETFQAVFVSDLKRLESAGMMHADMEKIRDLLRD